MNNAEELLRVIRHEASQPKDETELRGRKLREEMPELSELFIESIREANVEIKDGADPSLFYELSILNFIIKGTRKLYTQSELGLFIASMDDEESDHSHRSRI